MKRCAFCDANDTTATLADGTPICWRPCYAALLKVQRVPRETAMRLLEHVLAGQLSPVAARRMLAVAAGRA